MKSCWQKHPVRCLIIDIDVWVKTYWSSNMARDDMITIHGTDAETKMEEGFHPALYLRNWYIVATDMRL